ncbi:kielin/chordin-like protein [Microplitis mediator]|uniref:kielin/chordin-like protein n=1 Tax=Microplitis mediator TaxID=375433 RepID=UPI0025566EF0|nr:kielin/chordin-like protein [Microplitis mediator]
MELNNNFFFIYFSGTFLIGIIADEVCDKSKCPGPLAYYESLNCKPVYESSGDCCAIKYDCNNLNERSKKKCYVNNKTYEIGDKLKEEDANPCDVGCSCTEGHDGIAVFNCATVNCFQGPVKPGCYRDNSPVECCPGNEACPETPKDRVTCQVDGKEYKEGEYFEVESDSDLNCVCHPGYKGQNVEPFCVKPKHPYCSPDFRHASDVFNKCAPVYYSSQSPQTSCSVFSRCQNDKDVVIKMNSSSEANQDFTCEFGDLKMNQGDELNQATDYNSVCVKCVCEVGPVPTCQRLPDDECDVTKHPPFDNNY